MEGTDDLIARLAMYPHGRPPRAVPPDQVTTLESALGRRLPDLVRQLYLAVGTDFGPVGGILSPRHAGELWTTWTGERPATLHAWHWPAGALPLLDWGEGVYSVVELNREQLPVRRFRGDLFVPDVPGASAPTTPDEFAALFEDEAPSLAAWLEGLAEDTLQPQPETPPS